ncbi:quinolinate synthase NadA [Dissulfurimicrobium hydrothermale]|uniref:quinolinate synthase NadA n=2 Tax=Dissulfurimicrobium TaxID=1769732 RepID=UPI001EDAB4F3|nr:quinolinate synthase NadA [Dissulfurimicrobium hydrothermale]UKL13191.1 quinolinate synthase NadA [Dissulfurimicrobium hydrothermale]
MTRQDELALKIKRLATDKNAIILAHNYQPPEIQDLADITGDSLALSIEASKTNADIILFCGVHFMAETAAIVCPDKKVLLPVIDAGCAMADMLTAAELRDFKKQYPDVPVVTYVNSTAEVKAESYICCTSANAVQVVRSLGTPEVIMTPDMNLARWVQRHTDQKIHYWPGYCPIHNNLSVSAVKKARSEHPDAVLIAHPECPPEVIDMADVVRSTTGMIDYARESKEREFIIATEIGLLYTLKKQNPQKEFYPASPDLICQDMKKINLKDIIKALEDEIHQITVPEEIRIKALQAVHRMMDVPRD